MNHKVAVFRKEHFNAAHRLYVPAWNTERNDAIFGKCNNPNFHGHNYELVVKVVGYPDPVTGFVVDLKILSELIRDFVLKELDHKNLNLDTGFFLMRNPTAENIAIVIYDILREKIDQSLELQVRLYETDRNYVEYPVE